MTRRMTHNEDLFELISTRDTDLALARLREDPHLAHVPDSLGRTPLMLAVKRTNLRVARLLIKLGACPNRTDAHGRNALSYVASRPFEGNPYIRLLLDAGADPNLRDEHGESPLTWHLASSNHSYVEDLIEAGGTLRRGDEPLLEKFRREVPGRPDLAAKLERGMLESQEPKRPRTKANEPEMGL